MSFQHGKFHTGPVALDYSKAHTDGKNIEELFNDYGFVVRARTETGDDLHLWLFSYVIRGPEVIIEGQNLEDYEKPGSLTIEERVDSITWSNAGRTYTGKPPYYEVGGVHAGVKVELIFKENSKALYHHGRFEDCEPGIGDARYLVHCDVMGTINVEGKTYKISKGYGVHERILSYGLVAPRIDYMLGIGLSWAHGWSEDFSWYIMSGNGPMGKAYINIHDALIVADGPRNAWVEDTHRWLDPKIRQITPYKWNIRIITSKGRLDATVIGYARAFYTWTRLGGTLLVNQYVCDAVSKFTRIDGTVIEYKQMASMEHMRTLYRQDEY